MKWLHTLTGTYQTLSESTKNLLCFCLSYILVIVFCAAAARICAGWAIGYCTGIELSADLIETIRPCVGVTALGALLTQGVSLHA